MPSLDTIDSLWLDIRFAWRQLWRAPAFTLTAVATLALGIGANTGIFSLINGFLRPLPVPDADRIVVFASQHPGDETGARYRFSYPALADYRARATVFSDVFGFDTRIGAMTAGDRPARFLYHFVTGNFFTGLGVQPAAGRLFAPGEGERPGAERVVVLGYAYWMQRFGGSPAVIDTIVRIDGEPARVVGVAAEGFRGLFDGLNMDGYVPLANLHVARESDRLFTDRSQLSLTLAARLKADVSLAEAQSAADAVAGQLALEYPASNNGLRIRLIPEPLARPMPLRFFSTIVPVVKWLLLVLSGVVLVLACLNVTNLLFVRATVRQRELAIRTALGSGRARLIRLLLAESLLLSAAGAAAGMFLGQLAGWLTMESIDTGTDLTLAFDDIYFDWRVFTYGAAAAIFTTIVVGLVPAWRASQTREADVLHDGARGSASPGRRLLRRGLVVAQVAGSLVLLLVAGLLVRNLQRAQRLDLGFEPVRVATMRLEPRQAGYDAARASRFFDDLERRLRTVPGVEAAASSAIVPMTYAFDSCPIEPAERPYPDERSRPAVGYNLVGTGYFDTLKLPIVRGRAFNTQDTFDSPGVVIVNEMLAARLWPGEDAVGKRLNVFCSDSPGPWQVAGVARDSKYVAVFEPGLPYLYFAASQTRPTGRVLHIRSPLLLGDVAAIARRQIDALDPDVPVFDVRTMEQAIGGGFGWVLFRFGAGQAAALGLLGLALAIVGVYGVVSYGAAQRVREIGIRLALGASTADIRRLILTEGTGLVVTGIAAGLAASAMGIAVLKRFLVLVSASDPIAFAGVTLSLVAVALVACYLPARRAMRVDPMTALRHE